MVVRLLEKLARRSLLPYSAWAWRIYNKNAVSLLEGQIGSRPHSHARVVLIVKRIVTSSLAPSEPSSVATAQACLIFMRGGGANKEEELVWRHKGEMEVK